MAPYLCETCKKVFKQKSHFDKHKARKRPCKQMQDILPQVQSLDSVVKPPLKWVGGKTQILDEVLHHFPKEITDYYEPFLGGGSILLAVLSLQKAKQISISGKVYASDLNPNLIAFYKNLQTNLSAVITELKALQAEYSPLKKVSVNRKASTLEEAKTSPESYYFWIRSRFNAFKENERLTPQASAMFLFLNKTCFRGLYREGPNGFNVPFGNYKHPSLFDEAHLKEVSELIKDVLFERKSFTQALEKGKEGDFVYLDPPYAPESETSFVSYTADGFSLETHKALFAVCKTLQQKNIKFVMSNADVKLVKDAFPGPTYTTKAIVCRRAINSKNPESKTNEVLIQN